MRIGVDCDGVMYHFHKTATYLLNTERGYNLDWNEWTTWNWPKTIVTNNDWQWLWSKGVQMGLFRYGHLWKGAIEGVRKLSNIGDLAVVTHRPASAMQDTLDWLAYLKLPFKEVHLLTENQPKSSVKCDLYIDDKPENAIDVSNTLGRVTLLFERPWNKNFQWPDNPINVVTIKTWEEAVEHAQRIHR